MSIVILLPIKNTPEDAVAKVLDEDVIRLLSVPTPKVILLPNKNEPSVKLDILLPIKSDGCEPGYTFDIVEPNIKAFDARLLLPSPLTIFDLPPIALPTPLIILL